MADITLQGLGARQLQVLGDAMLEAGYPLVAQGFYRRLLQVAPNSSSAHTRLGLTIRPTERAQKMLDTVKLLEKTQCEPLFVGAGLATWYKNPPFIADKRFMELAEADFAIAPSGVNNWHWNLLIVLRAVQQAKAVPGDFVELGVYRGHTTKFVADYVDFAGWDKRWWLYDTFEGVPPDQNDSGRALGAQSYGEPFSFEEVRDRFAPYGNITVTKGRVPEILSDVCPEQIAFMHIDLNNSTAEVGALDALYDRLSPGGVIVFDDFCWATSAAQYQAEMKWFDARGLTVFPLPTGQGLFIKPPTT